MELRQQYIGIQIQHIKQQKEFGFLLRLYWLTK